MINILIAKGDLLSANNKCNDLITIHPDELSYKIKAAQILFYKGEFDETDRYLREIITK